MNTKKIILITIGIITATFISVQLYYRYVYGGNLVFHITNESLVDSAYLEIYIDDNKIIEDKLPNQGLYLLRPYPIKTSIGHHKAMIKINGELSKEIQFNTFLVTFIYVDYYGNRFDLNYGEMIERFYIIIKKHPIFFIV